MAGFMYSFCLLGIMTALTTQAVNNDYKQKRKKVQTIAFLRGFFDEYSKRYDRVDW
jgi:hypothetical protein